MTQKEMKELFAEMDREGLMERAKADAYDMILSVFRTKAREQPDALIRIGFVVEAMEERLRQSVCDIRCDEDYRRSRSEKDAMWERD